jgi:predicted ester cyclase
MRSRDALLRHYEDYLSACNSRDWGELGKYVADRVMVNGSVRSRAEYVSDVMATIAAFPDYKWELQRAVVEGEWLAVHLHDTGTRLGEFATAPGDGASVETDEFNMYRFRDGVIIELEGTADNARLAQ